MEATQFKAAKLLWREWDGEAVLYNVSSGNTHLVSPIAAEVLRFLENDRLTAEQISYRLTFKMGTTSDEEILNNVHAHLANLEHLGLVESIWK